MRAAWIALFYSPVRARYVGNGYREARRVRDAAVFLGERAPMPLTVEDEVVFAGADGQEVRARVRRLAEARGPSSLIWYSPRRPDRVSAAGPLGWIGVAAAVLSMLLLF
ncbi:hypothetical protein [Sphingomonas lenta]|uniref:Uncharacterized protein n=1 Tax=Sphingomonas lenta TaxID=1141887 RepID=A0A2A2SBH2_9SPHN|nr:hypothetical protein [Sphingomonas lenta]PAX06371.1 hypothetical protein CKY28_17355 [Sphingomonas lenta]